MSGEGNAGAPQLAIAGAADLAAIVADMENGLSRALALAQAASMMAADIRGDEGNALTCVAGLIIDSVREAEALRISALAMLPAPASRR